MEAKGFFFNLKSINVVGLFEYRSQGSAYDEHNS